MTRVFTTDADRPSPDGYPHRLDGLRRVPQPQPAHPGRPPIGERDHPPHPAGARRHEQR